MELPPLLKRWLDVLAGLISEWQDHARARKSIVVTRQDETFVVHRGSASGDLIATVASGKPMPAAIAKTLRDNFVIFELAMSHVITRHVIVPAQAKEFLQGIVRNQIERLSPWPPAQAVYGMDAKPSEADAGSLDVAVLVTSRAMIEGVCADLKASGLNPDRIDVRRGDGADAARVTLWKPAASGPQQPARSLPNMIGVGLAATVLLAGAISGWAIYSASALSSESEDVAAQGKALQRQAQSRKPDMSAMKPAERAWALKENSPVTVLVLESLTRALPDSAYLTELHLEDTTLRISGLATNPPALIEALEQSKHFTQVHFSAPTTKGQTGELYKFSIEMRVEDRPQVIAD